MNPYITAAIILVVLGVTFIIVGLCKIAKKPTPYRPEVVHHIETMMKLTGKTGLTL